MIPDKIIKTEAKENVGTFSLFDIEHFLRRVLRNWYWFLLMGLIGYGIAYFYSKYYAQRVYASSLTLSISNNTSSYFTPNQSINFIWGQGGNQDGVLLKKLLLSRTHNEYLVNELDLYTNYTTKGLVKETYLDKYDSPVLLEIDKNHLQQVNYPITFIPKGKDRYEVVLPAEGQSLSLYNYKTESMQPVQNYERQQNKVISIGEWYEAPNLKFKLNKNPNPSPIIFQNIIVSLSTVNDAVNTIINTLSIEFDKEINSMMVISKKGYNLNGTVNFLNISVDELIKKRLKDQNVVDKNTEVYLAENLDVMRKKLDSSANKLNNLKITEKLYDIKDRDEKSIQQIQDLDNKKAELLTKINSLNTIKNTVASANLDNLISMNAAGIDDGIFTATMSELKTLYEKRRELATIYTPNSEPMKEINRLIAQSKGGSQGALSKYYLQYSQQLNNMNSKIAELEKDLDSFPEKQRKYLDVERGYNMV
jgi:hypothetical protein